MATSMTRQIVVNQEIAICSKHSNIIICEWFNNNRQIIVVSTEIKIDENTSQIVTSSCEQCNIQCDVCKSVQNKMIVASRVEVVKQIVLEQIQTDTDGNVNYTIKINKIAVTTKNITDIKKIAQKVINKRSDSRSNRFNDIRNDFIDKMFEITDDGSHVRRKSFAIARA